MLEKSRCEEVVSDTRSRRLLPAAEEGQQIIVVGQRKSSNSNSSSGCAQCVQKGGISMTGGAHIVNENYVDEQ